MRKIFRILILLCVFCLLLSSCSAEDISKEDFEKQVIAYREKIQNIDSDLKIYESTLICQDGDCIVTYSVEAPSGACFGIWVEFISVEKTKIKIEFFDTAHCWSEENINLFSAFISVFTHNRYTFDKIKAAVSTMRESDYYRFNSKSSLSAINDFDGRPIYYEETFYNK